MWDQEPELLKSLKSYLAKHPLADQIGFNQPYSIKGIEAHTYDKFSRMYALPAFIFEVRQDCLSSPQDVQFWGDFILDSLAAAGALNAAA